MGALRRAAVSWACGQHCRNEEECCQPVQSQGCCIGGSCLCWQARSRWSHSAEPAAKKNCWQVKEDPGSTDVHPPTRY